MTWPPPSSPILPRATAKSRPIWPGFAYRGEGRALSQLWTVVARECPAAVLGAWRQVVLACLMFSIPAAVGYRMLREQPRLAEEVLPDVMLDRAEAGRQARGTGQRYVEVAARIRPAMASAIITNNVRVALYCFAGGIFLGVGALVLLALNGLQLGASFGHFVNVGLGAYLGEFIIGHGILELTAIWIAGGAGFMLGRTLVAPGELSRADALVLAGQRAIRMLGASVVCLLVAGMIEGLVSASGASWAGRIATNQWHTKARKLTTAEQIPAQNDLRDFAFSSFRVFVRKKSAHHPTYHPRPNPQRCQAA